MTFQMEESYLEEKKIFQKALESGEGDALRAELLKSANDVDKLAKSLGKMKHFGEDFTSMLNNIRKERRDKFRYRQGPTIMPKRPPKAQIKQQKKWWKFWE